MSTESKLQIYFFAALLLVAVLLNFFVLQPFFSALFLAVILTIIFRPAHEKITRAIGGYSGFGAFLTIVLMIFLIVLPLGFFGFFLFKDAQSFYGALTIGGGGDFVHRVFDFIEILIKRFVPDLSIDLVSYVKSTLGLVVQNLGGIFGRLLGAVLQVFLILLGVFYFLRDGKKFREHFILLSPLSDDYDRTILGRLEGAVTSVVKGALLVALIQGILCGIGFALFGVPNPMLWGGVAAIAALIPGFGTSLVLLPAIIYLFFFSTIFSTLALTVWGVLAVGLIDNILGPILIRRGLKIHPFLILLSVLGGLLLFGPVGFLAGPVALALLFALFEIYPLLTKR